MTSNAPDDGGRTAMNVRMDAEFRRATAELAEQLHVSKQEVLRVAVLEKWRRDRHETRVSAAIDASLAEHGDLLDRLGRA